MKLVDERAWFYLPDEHQGSPLRDGRAVLVERAVEVSFVERVLVMIVGYLPLNVK
ncbi:MAG: hypothetical protein OXH31_00305 [Gammaproteobacteria bacterium]|nr:hypothetical protein [Gammaproteobacteria bacterium]